MAMGHKGMAYSPTLSGDLCVGRHADCAESSLRLSGYLPARCVMMCGLCSCGEHLLGHDCRQPKVRACRPRSEGLLCIASACRIAYTPAQQKHAIQMVLTKGVISH